MNDNVFFTIPTLPPPKRKTALVADVDFALFCAFELGFNFFKTTQRRVEFLLFYFKHCQDLLQPSGALLFLTRITFHVNNKVPVSSQIFRILKSINAGISIQRYSDFVQHISRS